MSGLSDSAVPVRYLTEGEAAQYLRVSPNTLRGWRVSGRGPMYRDHGGNAKGGRITYKVDDLDRWSDGRSKLSSSDVKEPASSTT